MKKSGKSRKKEKESKSRKNQKKVKNLEEEEENPQFSSEDDYMHYVGLKNEMTNNINENFDVPFYLMMGNSDNIITKSTYTKIEYENGKPVNEELYQSESVNHKDKKGHKITEKKEKYKNNVQGIEKISHQKLLDGKGTKVIKKININNGDNEEHNIYQGLNEKNVKDFNKRYDDYKKKVKLDDMFQKVKLLGNKRHNDDNKGKVLLLGDGKEPKQKEKEKEKENKINTRSNKSKNKSKNKNKRK